MDENQDLNLVAMNIIANAGDARSFAFQALSAAKGGDFDKAKDLMKKAKDASAEAHKSQTELLFKEANGEKLEVNVLLIHSQDHLMTSILAMELIEELIGLYKNK